MAKNGESKGEKIVIVLDSSDDEAVENGRSGEIGEGSKRKCNQEEDETRSRIGSGSVTSHEENHVYGTKAGEEKLLEEAGGSYPTMEEIGINNQGKEEENRGNNGSVSTTCDEEKYGHRTMAVEYNTLGDLSDFSMIAAMFELGARKRKSKRKRRDKRGEKPKETDSRNPFSVMEVGCSNGCGSAACDKEKDVYRTKAEEYKMLPGLSDYPLLAAKFARKRENKRKNRGKKRKKKHREVQSGDPYSMTDDAGSINEALDLPQTMIKQLAQKNNDEESKSSNGSGSVACEKGKYLDRTKVEEYKMLPDSSDFPLLAAMFSSGGGMRKKKRKKREIQQTDDAGSINEALDPQQTMNKQLAQKNNDEESKNSNGSGYVACEKEKCAYKTKVEEYKMLPDSSDFPLLAAMLSAGGGTRKKKRKTRKMQQAIDVEHPNVTMEEVEKRTEPPERPPVKMPGNGNDSLTNITDDAGSINEALDPKQTMNKQLAQKNNDEESKNSNGPGYVACENEKYAYRAKAEEYKMLLDSSDFPLLAAMLSAGGGTRKKKRKMREMQQMEEAEKRTEPPERPPVKMPGNGNDSLTNITDDAGSINEALDPKQTMNKQLAQKNNDEESKNSNGSGNVACETEKYAYRTKAEEYKMLLDSSDFPLLAAMLSAGGGMRKKKRKMIGMQQMEDTEKITEPQDRPPVKMPGNGNDSLTNIIPGKTTLDESMHHKVVIVLDSSDDEEKEKEANKTSNESTHLLVDEETYEHTKMLAAIFAPNAGIRKKSRRKNRKKRRKKTQKLGSGDLNETVGSAVGEKPVNTCKAVEEMKAVEADDDVEPQKNAVSNLDKLRHVNKEADKRTSSGTRLLEKREDNMVLRKLFRAPRYFDPPGISSRSCYRCGEDDHEPIHCPMQKRKKPCYICACSEHNGRNCKKGKDCYICSKRGHIANDCPDKDGIKSENPNICLRCGDLGHLMFSCSNDFCPDDLKMIQCYVCKKFGHLCCFDYRNESLMDVSCYNCGQSCHSGSECSEPVGIAMVICHKCGQKGHSARKCKKPRKVVV